MQWYLKVWRQFADFSGRARRTEFWMFVLFNVIAGIILSILDNVLGLTYGEPGTTSGVLSSIYGLAVLIPSLAVGARRLHDTGRTGWWWLIGIIPIVGFIVLIVFWATDGNRGPNQHGMNPKEMAGAPYVA